MRSTLIRLVCLTALVGGIVAAATPTAANDKEKIEFNLVPSSPAIAACFPDLKAEVEIELETATKGRDELELKVTGAPANEELTVFLLEMPGSPIRRSPVLRRRHHQRSGQGKERVRTHRRRSILLDTRQRIACAS